MRFCQSLAVSRLPLSLPVLLRGRRTLLWFSALPFDLRQDKVISFAFNLNNIN